jgi:hypothetical protein
MTSLQVVGLGIRLFAVSLVMSTIPFIFAANGLRGGKVPLVYHVVGPALLVVSALLWAFPLWLARRLLPGSSPEDARSDTGLSGPVAARVGCGLIGLWCFANAVPKLVLTIYKALLFVGTLSFMEGLDVTGREEIVTSVTMLIVGLLLVLRSGVFARLVTGGPSAYDTANGAAEPSAADEAEKAPPAGR